MFFLLLFLSDGTGIKSTLFPAFWLAPGQPEHNPTPTCTAGINTELVSGSFVRSFVRSFVCLG
jgi:hypothetical protein